MAMLRYIMNTVQYIDSKENELTHTFLRATFLLARLLLLKNTIVLLIFEPNEMEIGAKKFQDITGIRYLFQRITFL